jgi:molybdate transport system ATP-binding protein
VQIRRDLRAYRAGVPTLLVTHDPVDALALADRVIVLENGSVVQDAPPDALVSSPRSDYVADLVGVNLYRGELTDSGLRTSTVEIVAFASASSGAGFATIHPRAVALHLERPSGSPRNVWRGRVGAIEDEGERLRVAVDGELRIVAEITRASFTEMGLAVGTQLFASVKATEVNAYPV